MGEVPVDNLLIDFLPWLGIGHDSKEDIVGAKADSIEMVDLFLVSDEVSVQIATRVISSFNRNDEIFIFDLLDDCMDASNAHSSDFDIIGWRMSSFSDLNLILVNRILHLSGQLRILVQIGQVRLLHINLLVILFFMHDLHLLLFVESCRVIITLFSDQPQLRLSILPLLKLLRSQRELLEHFFHLHQLFFQLLTLSGQGSDELIRLTFINHCFILDLLCLIGVS